MSRFYLTLPSNSSAQYYPENTAARYTTKLGNTIELEGDWEVGLLEISTPSRLANVPEERCYYVIYLGRKYYRKIVLPLAHHRHIGSLIDIMHTEQRVQVPIQNDRHLMVEFVPSGNNISIKLDPHGAYGDVAVRFSRDLARILGFNECTRCDGTPSLFDSHGTHFLNIRLLRPIGTRRGGRYLSLIHI